MPRNSAKKVAIWCNSLGVFSPSCPNQDGGISGASVSNTIDSIGNDFAKA